MGHPIAIAFLHGIGRTEEGYSRSLERSIASRFAKDLGGDVANPSVELFFEEVNWSAALQEAEDVLAARLEAAASLRFGRLRHFMLDFAADAIAYQPTHDDRSVYDAIHGEVADGLARLAARAGARAPLILVAHSLGTVIASNYCYDLLKSRGSFIAPEVRKRIGKAPLERGETLTRFYTMGSPIALWSLRYPGYGEPLTLPSRRLQRHHPGLETRWVNLYDPDDVIATPLRPVSDRYAAAVSEDRTVDVGSLLTRWNPLAHTGYWSNASIGSSIGEAAAKVWRESSAVALVPARRRRTTSRSARSAARP